MYEDLNNELEAAHHAMLRKSQINSMMIDLDKSKQELSDKIAILKQTLDKENLDVKKLEGKSLSHIFHSLLGDLKDHMDKEVQEALAAQFKYEQVVRDLDLVNAEISRLRSEEMQLTGCENTYQIIYDKKKNALLQSSSQTALQILQLTEQIGITKNLQKEINEAIAEGNNVINHIKNISDSLDKAEGWGTWDLLGGGLISDLAKHSHIDDAKNEVEEIQSALLRFRTELADVKINSSISIETDGFGKFADFFFDGIFADWSMQTKIHDSQESVEKTKMQVEQVLQKLNHLRCAQTTRLGQLEQEICELVTQAN